ncbi:MAG TPA: RNA polymerase sigma factor region1.1 domain-containing protein, partial [bacterium]|nr:RNA polymerase sigma factor region1.1 domain-containing protein [bacterium]
MAKKNDPKDNKKKASAEEIDLSALVAEHLSDGLDKFVKKEPESRNDTKQQKQKVQKLAPMLAEDDTETFDDEELVREELAEEDILEEIIEDDQDEPDYDDLMELESENDELGSDEDILHKPKERGLKRIPIDRNEDKRRVGKGLKKFIDVTVPAELLDGMSDEIQTLLKKGKLHGRITYDEVLAAIPHAEEDLELLDDVYDRFSKLGVQLVDSLDKDELFTIDTEKKEEEVN